EDRQHDERRDLRERAEERQLGEGVDVVRIREHDREHGDRRNPLAHRVSADGYTVPGRREEDEEDGSDRERRRRPDPEDRDEQKEDTDPDRRLDPMPDDARLAAPALVRKAYRAEHGPPHVRD